MVRYLTESDVKQLLTMPLALQVVEEALKAHAEHRAIDVPRARIHLPTGTQHVLQAAAPELKVIGFKCYYTNPRGKSFYVQLFNTETAKLEAVVEAVWMSMVRTGAASGVATRRLAIEDASIVGQIGAGYQAIGQLEAVRKCDVITVDGRGTARKECGDLLPAIEKGLLQWDSLAEIGEVIAGRARGRTSARQITLYESHGMGIQDLYAGAKVLELAREKGVGTDLPTGE